MNLAYEAVKEVDALDISKEGSEAWEAAMKRYDERIDRVETRITARLKGISDIVKIVKIVKITSSTIFIMSI